MATMVPDRGDDPKRRVPYSDLNVTKLSPSGAYEISHMQGGERHKQTYYGYTKREAMKQHKEKYAR